MKDNLLLRNRWNEGNLLSAMSSQPELVSS